MASLLAQQKSPSHKGAANAKKSAGWLCSLLVAFESVKLWIPIAWTGHMWIRCKPTNPVPKCFFVCRAASHTQEKVFLIRPMWRNVWMRGTEESSVKVGDHVSVCVCVSGVKLCRSTCFWMGSSCFIYVFQGVWEFLSVCVCVHWRPPAPHHQDSGLKGGSYSLFPTLLSQQVAPNVLFSLRKLLALL